MDEAQRQQRIHQHLEAIRVLQSAAAAEHSQSDSWPPKGFYLLWHVVGGMTLGAVGASVSLLANVVGAPLFKVPPLQLIRVYLTFPMGEAALHAEAGLVLFMGCVLYLCTGALYGIVFHITMSVWFKGASGQKRLVAATAMGLGLWLVNFYLILSWLQPALLGGDWIIRLVPVWVAALTHLAFAWTMLLIESWGEFVPHGASIAIVLLAFGCGDLAPPETAATGAVAAIEASPSDPRPIEYATWHSLETGEYLAYNRRATLQQRGKIVYDTNCVGCHGADGAGNGPAAVRLLTKPRDFTRGIYKFRSTDSGSLPMESDLHRTITRGLGGGVSMPAFRLMPEHDKVAVIEYIKGFYPPWDEDKDERVVVPLPVAPDDLMHPQRAKRGRIVYLSMQCGTCHGAFGAGADAEQTEFTDEWGNPQRAFDFTRGTLKGGDSPEDIYRTFTTGLRSIMPAFPSQTLASVTAQAFEQLAAPELDNLRPGEYDELAPLLREYPADATAYRELDAYDQDEIAVRNSWDLVAYIISLRKTTTTAAAVLGRPAR